MPRQSGQLDRSPNDLQKYPRLDEREVVYLWHVDWWDGPISGSILHREERYWFQFYCDSDEAGNPYYYLVYPLRKDEANFADWWSAEDEKLRAEWNSLSSDQKTKDLPEAAALAERWKAHHALLPNFEEKVPVAWFMSGSNTDFYAVQLH